MRSVESLTTLALLGVALTWGSSYLAAQWAGLAAPVVVVLLWRYAFAALACLLIIVCSRQGLRRREVHGGVLLGLTQAAILALETFGVTLTSAANAGVLISLTILLVPFIEAGLARRVPAIGIVLASLMAVLGVVLLTGGVSAWRIGDLLILATALVRSVHVVIIGRLTRPRPVRGTLAEVGDESELRVLPLTTVQLLVGVIIYAPIAVGMHGSAVASSLGDPGFFAAALYLALGCSVFAFLAQTWAVKHTSATRASLLLGTEPVWAIAIAIVLGGETPGPLALLGAIFIIGGCYWGQAVERRGRLTP